MSFPRKNSALNRRLYATRRMRLAAERLLYAANVHEEIQAGRWAVIWAVAAGAPAPARLLTASALMSAVRYPH
jgi:hypothetical protein